MSLLSQFVGVDEAVQLRKLLATFVGNLITPQNKQSKRRGLTQEILVDRSVA
jgi:hypothetical protein